MSKVSVSLTKSIVQDEVIVSKIYLIRGQKVMLDRDLAELYDVENKQLKRAVRRNIIRFPQDFMFELSKEEYHSLRSQFGTLKRGEHSKFRPYAFTEQGVAMLSGILNSERAILVNIQIMRMFTKMRQMLLTHKDLLLKVERLEQKFGTHDRAINVIFEHLKKLIQHEEKPGKKIGFEIPQKKSIKTKITRPQSATLK